MLVVRLLCVKCSALVCTWTERLLQFVTGIHMIVTNNYRCNSLVYRDVLTSTLRQPKIYNAM